MKIKKEDIKYFVITIILLFCFFEPQIITIKEISSVSKIYLIFKYISYFVSIFFTIDLIKNKKFSKNLVGICLFSLVVVVSTAINRSSLIVVAIKYILNIVSFSINLYYLLLHNEKMGIQGIRFIFNVLVFINFCTLLLYPDGMYMDVSTNTNANWFLGYDNLHILYILPCLFFNLLYNKKNNKLSIISVIMVLICYYSCIVRFSATSLCGLLMITLYFIPKIKFFVIKYFKTICTIILVIMFLIVVCRIQNIFKYIIVDLLGKKLDFSGRIYIWDYIIEFIKKQPILGYGYETSIIRFFKTDLHRAYHAHNEILEIMYKTGICGVSIMGYIFLKFVNNVTKIKKDNIKVLFMLVTWAYLLMFITEYYDILYYVYLFIFAERLKENEND